MLGLWLGMTDSNVIAPVSKKRVRMSLRFDPITSEPIFAPICLPTNAAYTFPKFPVGTAKTGFVFKALDAAT